MYGQNLTEHSDIQRDLQMLAEDLHQLEVEHGLFFAGRVPRPPVETRARVEAIITRWGRVHVSSSADRFRFNTLQSRFFTYTSLWDRALRAREEGQALALPDRIAGCGRTGVDGERVRRRAGATGREPRCVHDLVHRPASGDRQARGPLRVGVWIRDVRQVVPSYRFTSSSTSCEIGSMSFGISEALGSCARLQSRMGG